MSQPKISAKLNNCPMHFLTPEIVAECIQRGSDSSRSIPELDDAYERLKKTFADYYLEGEELSWLQLSNLLQNIILLISKFS